MVLPKKEPSHSALSGSAPVAPFPDTRTEVLAEAAGGNWTPFLDQYLRPCWREVVLTCRTRGIPLSDADDLYQELMLRLLRDSRFGPRVRNVLGRCHQDTGLRANLPGRYLKARELPLRFARFRTYLKRVIHNVVLEAVRAQPRRPKPASDKIEKELEPWIEQSISRSLDHQWAAACLTEAVRRLRQESARARTRGQRRLFEVLYLFTVENQSPAEIARRFDIDRSTASSLLTDAKARFIVHLQRATGITDSEELRSVVAAAASELQAAMAQAFQSSIVEDRTDAIP